MEPISENILSDIRRKSAKIKHRPSQEDIDTLLKKPGFLNWVLQTFGTKRKIKNIYNLEQEQEIASIKEAEQLEEAARIVKILEEAYSYLIPSSFKTVYPIFEFIFVRHGESCANAIQKRKGNTLFQKGTILHKLYKDPELTEKGVKSSEKRWEKLRDTFIENPGPFADDAYVIASSALLRAQETAYHMLAKHRAMPVNVFPHLGEIMLLGSFEVPAESDDNSPNSAKDQLAYLNYIYRDTPFQKGEDLREMQYSPNLKKFFDWAVQHPEKFPEVNGVKRAIIFTHSNLLKSKFKLSNCLNPPKQELHRGKLANNDFLVTVYNPSNKPFEPSMKFLDSAAVYPKWHYYDTRDITVDVPCGLEPRRCRRMTPQVDVYVTEPCSKSGGKRKTRRSPKGSLRLRRRSTRRRLEK